MLFCEPKIVVNEDRMHVVLSEVIEDSAITLATIVCDKHGGPVTAPSTVCCVGAPRRRCAGMANRQRIKTERRERLRDGRG